MHQSPRVPHRAGRSLGLAAATLVLAALTPALAPAADGPTKVLRAQTRAVRPQIVGGNQIPITRAPWQVLIEHEDSFCGGSILDARHVLTAAHCTFSPLSGAPQDSPFVYTVTAGASTTGLLGGAADRKQQRFGAIGDIAAVSRHPGYHSPGTSGSTGDFVDDVAVITLARPLDLDGTTAAPVALPSAGPNPTSGSSGFVAGFGLQQDGGLSPDGNLYGLDTTLIDGALPDAGDVYNAYFLSTQSVNGSTCQGDSGGGLVTNGEVVGVVSNGVRCGYDEVEHFSAITAGENLTFIRNVVDGTNNPIPRAPVGGADVSLRTPVPPKVGDSLTCSAGTWTNGPSFLYAFTDAASGQVLQVGPSNVYLPVAGDVGRGISCRASASTAGGTGLTLPTQSTPPVVPGQAAAPSPAPSPAPTARHRGRRLRVSLVPSSSRLVRGSRVRFRITVRNAGAGTARSVRMCVRLDRRFAVVSRGGARRAPHRRLCWTTRKVRKHVTKRFVVRVSRRARSGRVVTAVRVTARSTPAASARRVVTVRRR